MTRSVWSLDDYCSQQEDLLRLYPNSDEEGSYSEDFWSVLLGNEANLESNRKFLTDLRLPVVHPFCLQREDFFVDDSIPPMGSLSLLQEAFAASGKNPIQGLLTVWYTLAPALLAMGELWMRLLAGAAGPLGIAYLILCTFHESKRNKNRLSLVVVLTVASCLILMTDTLYVLQNGPNYGAILFLSSFGISLRVCWKHKLRFAGLTVGLLVLLSIRLVSGTKDLLHFGNPVETVHLEEGLYFDSSNELVRTIASQWQKGFRTYDLEHGATQWMPTGDSRTGLPFIIHKYPPEEHPKWIRVFLEVQDDHDPVSEYVALDISFPSTGHKTSTPIYLVLHGLHGGSMEEYIRDLTIRRNKEGSTVVVMIARGLMNTPIRGWKAFHGARTVDAHTASVVLKERVVVAANQVLVGVGYSMGAIVLSNTVATYGADCAFDAAVAVSGGLDMRYQEHAHRAQRLWQPMLTGTLREEFLLGHFGHRVKKQLTESEYLKMMRATHITEIDRYAVVPINGFEDLGHYYREMSALGDIPHDPDTDRLVEDSKGKIHTVSIPFLVVHALDDPLITWRATVQNEGFMHPKNLVQSGSGHLMILLTRAGGHVGWPLGRLPTEYKWKWMSDLVMSFANAVDESSKKVSAE